MSGLDFWQWVGALVLVLLVVGIGVTTVTAGKRNAAREATEAEQRREAVRIGIERGILNEHGRPMCVICQADAMRFGVRTGRPWFDTIPLLSGLNRLYAMPWRYTVVDDVEGGYRFCEAHHRAATQRLEQAHAGMRAEHARFNATQQQKVAMLDQGGLEQLVREDADTIRTSIGLRGVMAQTLDTRQLTHHADVHVMPVTSTDSHE